MILWYCHELVPGVKKPGCRRAVNHNGNTHLRLNTFMIYCPMERVLGKVSLTQVDIPAVGHVTTLLRFRYCSSSIDVIMSAL